MKYDFSEKEAQVLVELINLAVKAGGLSVAENAVILTKKLSSPLPEIEPKKEGKKEDTK